MDSLDKEIEQIKISRMKPKERFLYNIMKEVDRIHYGNYPNSIFFRIKDIIYFRYDMDTKNFYSDTEKLYIPLTQIDKTPHNGMLIKKSAEKYLKITIKDVISTNAIYKDTYCGWMS